MKVTVIGTGYVGLVTGACFAEMGNTVTCVDIDSKKIENLKNGIIPIYEPGLEAIVAENHTQGRLHFTTSLAQAMEVSDIFFIAVGTPQGEDGSADLKYVLAVAKEIGENLQRECVIVDKSTVPVGTADKVKETVDAVLTSRGLNIPFHVVSNPEFLKEGAAVADFMKPDRIIIGADSEHSRNTMSALYAPFNRNHQKLIYMGIRDAELTKYAANAMLATKISFMNEISNLCEKLDVDVENVRQGIGSDQRIGFNFIYPGCGYGGSCFPKDVKALIQIANQNDIDANVLKAVEHRNEKQKNILVEKVIARFGSNLQGKKFAVWGLAFKPGTDDMREAPSKIVIANLIKMGASVEAYDPVAMEAAKDELSDFEGSGKLQYSEDKYEALKNSDALILVTEWKQFRNPDFDFIKSRMNTPVIFDGRNQYDPSELKALNFEYYGIGR